MNKLHLVLILALTLAGCSAKKGITADELQACNRNVKVYVEEKREPEPTLPRVPQYPIVSSMKAGQTGWISWINAHKDDGSLYVNDFETVTPKMTESTSGVYSDRYGSATYTPSYDIFILRTKEGIMTDCDSHTFVIPDSSTGYWHEIPVVGTFSTKAK